MASLPCIVEQLNAPPPFLQRFFAADKGQEGGGEKRSGEERGPDLGTAKVV
jgi:hypothetical protein